MPAAKIGNDPVTVLMDLTLPPPFHGSNIANETLWNSWLRDRYRCVLVDMSDHRGIDNLGRLDFMNVVLALRSLLRHCRALLWEKPAVVYLCVSQNTMAYLRDGILIILTKILSRASVIVHLHGNYFMTFYSTAGWLTRRFVDATLSKVDVGIVLGESLTSNLSRWVGCIRVVPNGTDVGRESPVEGKISELIASRPFIVTFLSNLIESKGILDFLRAATLVSREEPDVEFRVAGAWGADPIVRSTASDVETRAWSIVNEGGLQERVRFLGVVESEAKRSLLYETHVFVLPTYFDEGQPLSILEAMAAGCVVVSTHKGAIPETVQDGQTGFIVPSGEPRAIAERIVSLSRDRDGWSRMALAARERYERHYTTERFLQRMSDVFSQAQGTVMGQR